MDLVTEITSCQLSCRSYYSLRICEIKLRRLGLERAFSIPLKSPKGSLCVPVHQLGHDPYRAGLLRCIILIFQKEPLGANERISKPVDASCRIGGVAGRSSGGKVCPWQVPSREFDAKTIETDYFLTPELVEETGIGAGYEVLIVGLLSKITGEARNIPIARIGNLAMIPTGPVVPTDLGNMEAYLVEAQSLGGISGSPVFIRQTAEVSAGVFKWGTNIPAVIQGCTNVFHLLGVAHGHWNIDPTAINQPEVEHVEEGFNVGLALVVPAQHFGHTAARQGAQGNAAKAKRQGTVEAKRFDYGFCGE